MKDKIKILLFTFLLIISGVSTNSNINNLINKKLSNYNGNELYTALAETYTPPTNTLGQVAVISKINSVDELVVYSFSKNRPSSVILNVNENMMLVNDKEEEIGIELKDAYIQYLKDKIIPLIYIKNEIIKDAFLNYYPQNLNILDMAVISNDAKIVKDIRIINTIIRGIIDYSNKTITKEKWYDVVKEANMSYANTVILNNLDATEEAIYYIQARLKTVWVNNDVFSNLDTIRQVSDGAYGIISPNPNDVFLAFNVFAKTLNSLRNLNRKSYLIAHRGIGNTNYENSLEGVIEAYESGATHVEIDVQVTKDNKLALMHDATIDRTTTGSGTISQYTSDELKEFKIDSSSLGKIDGEGVPIPLLDDIVNYTKDKEMVLVIEIKNSNLSTSSLIRECLEKYDAFSNSIVIGFSKDQLNKMKEVLPEIPYAYLGSLSYNDFEEGLQTLNSLNAAINTTKTNYFLDYNKKLIARGYAPWHWTYTEVEECQKAMTQGVQGITNDCADEFKDFAIKLYTDKKYVLVDNFESKELTLKYETYLGKTDREVKATSIYLEEYDDYAYAIYQARFVSTKGTATNEFIVFSDVIKLIKEEKFISVEKMLDILSKDNNSLTESDYSQLLKMLDSYQLLNEDDKKLVNYSEIEDKIEAYNKINSTNNNQTNNSISSSENNVNSSTNEDANNRNNKLNIIPILISSIALLSLVGVLLLFFIKKKKNNSIKM